MNRFFKGNFKFFFFALLFCVSVAYTTYSVYRVGYESAKKEYGMSFSKMALPIVNNNKYICTNTSTGFKCDLLATPTRTVRPTITLTPTKTKRVLKTNTPTPEYEEEYHYPGATYNPPPCP